MGIRLVGLALNPSWCVLSERARLVLLQMCYVARDLGTAQTASGQYFGGHANLIISVLGKDPDALTRSNRETCERSIQRAIKELKQAGAVSLVTASAPGHQAVYALHPNRFPNLGQEPLPVDNSDAPANNTRHLDPPYARHPAPGVKTEHPTKSTPNTRHLDPPRSDYKESNSRHLKEDQPTQPATQLWADAVPDLWITR